MQAQALFEAEMVGGLLGPIEVGGGKTLTSLLLPSAFGARRPLILTRARLRDQMLSDLEEYRKHWNIRDDITVMSYTMLSREEQAEWLDINQPDLIICDEAHKIANPDSTRHKRLFRYMDEAEEQVTFCVLSGTLFGDELRAAAQLSNMALLDMSPVPYDGDTLACVANVVDEVPRQAPEKRDWAIASKLLDGKPAQGDLRHAIQEALRARIVSTPGVVASPKGSLGVSLEICRLEMEEIPDDIREAIGRLEDEWVDPDGNELSTILEFTRVARQLGMGFYYRWIDPDPNWFHARNTWNRKVRHILGQNKKHLDSKARIEKHYEQHSPDQQDWARWKHYRQFPEPEREAVWVSTKVLDRAILHADWMASTPVMLWYRHRAVRDYLVEQGIPDVGLDMPEAPTALKMCASIESHGEGRNMQAWRQSLVLECPASATKWEQLLGRMHRSGQKHDVLYAILQHTYSVRQALEGAILKSGYVERTTGSKQKLQYADFSVDTF